MSFIVAIDGTAGTGKGTATEKISKQLGLLNIDTGATYRCVTLAMLRKNIKIEETQKIEKLLEEIKIEIKNEKGEQSFFLDGEEVTDKIRTPEVNQIVSPVSALKIVRYKMVELQRKLAEGKDVIMEGRDIGTYVFPNADVKIYLDATLEERANRRYRQNQKMGIEQSYEEILENIRQRDENDKNKEIGALTVASDAIVIDTTHLTIEEQTNKMIEIINQKRNKKEKETKKEKGRLWQGSKWLHFQRAVTEFILKVLYILIYRVKVIGKDKVPQEGPFILCGNHVSFIKVPVIYLFAPRRTHVIGKAELFNNPFLNWLGTIFEVIPVKRGKQDVDSMKKCLRTIKEGEPLAIFPEGTRNGLEKKVKVKNGAAYMAFRTKTKVVPVGIAVTKRPFPRIILNFGDPIDCSNIDESIPEKEAIEKATTQIMDNIIKLTNETV